MQTETSADVGAIASTSADDDRLRYEKRAHSNAGARVPAFDCKSASHTTIYVGNFALPATRRCFVEGKQLEGELVREY